MIVTTSEFSGDAQRLALAHAIKLVDGRTSKPLPTPKMLVNDQRYWVAEWASAMPARGDAPSAT
jgi:hypothetical protein